jgi:hypothetical protein
MRNFFIFIILLISVVAFSQTDDKNNPLGATPEKEVKPSITLYKMYTLARDTTFVDTSLTIKSEYKYNLLRKDIFGLLPFANEGHTYNTLDFGLISKSVMPSIGFTGKHFNYLEVNKLTFNYIIFLKQYRECQFEGIGLCFFLHRGGCIFPGEDVSKSIVKHKFNSQFRAFFYFVFST